MVSRGSKRSQQKTFSVFWKKLGIYFNVVFVKRRVVKAYFSSKPLRNTYSGKIRRDLERYFYGEIRKIRCKYTLINVSDFTRKVLKIVKRIPYGSVKFYSEIAEILNTSPRAVGQALKRNPIPVIIPCHRVVSKSGLGGYSAGLRIKMALLELERDR